MTEQMQNTVYIIGAGAIGKALAVFLKLAGRKVVLIRGSVENAPVQIEHLRIETESGSIYEADIKITTLSAFETLEGIVVLTNKSYGNENLASVLKTKIGSSPIVLLQNGLGVEQPFMNSHFPEIYRCVLFVTSQSIGDSSVRFKPVAVCPIGIEKGENNSLDQIVQLLNTSNFGFKSEEHIQPIIWKKAIINCVFNSVCSLLEVDNGIFHRNKEALGIARSIISECITIAQDKGVILSLEEVEASLLQISLRSDGQLISTLQDIKNRRRTEIDSLNLAIAGIADGFNKGDIVPETRLLGKLTKLKADISIKGDYSIA